LPVTVANRDRDSYGNSHGDCDSYGDIYSNRYRDSDSNRDVYADGYPNSYTDVNGDLNSHSYGDSYGDIYADPYTDTDCYGHGYSDVNSNSYSHGDSDSDGHGDIHGYGDGYGYTYSGAIGNADSEPYPERLRPVGWLVDESSGSVVPRNHSGWVHGLHAGPGHRDHATRRERG
jgi:hypothetical protein